VLLSKRTPRVHRAVATRSGVLGGAEAPRHLLTTGPEIMAKRDYFEWLGRTIDAKYRVEEIVDEGPLGVVYRAHHLGFDETVALKCLKVPPSLKREARDTLRERFIAEGRFLHRLSRSNAGIVQALDVGSEAGADGAFVPYLVLEWLEGVSLADDLEQRARSGAGGRSLEAAIALLEPAVLALASAHEQGVAHCDVKPSNLFLTTIGSHTTLKVLDFGIAKVFTEGTGLELEGPEKFEATRAFSAPYAAPEQFTRHHGGVSPRTDVFALALVLVEVVSGQQALKGGSLVELLRASVDPLHRPTLRARDVACSAEVDDVLRRALAVEPAARFATALEFWQAFTDAVRAPPPPPSSKERLPRDRISPLPLAPAKAGPTGRMLEVTVVSLVALAAGVSLALAFALTSPPPSPGLMQGLTAPAPALSRYHAAPPSHAASRTP
jgi:eukaryotic-like serine/threonine-protein kinase